MRKIISGLVTNPLFHPTNRNASKHEKLVLVKKAALKILGYFNSVFSEGTTEVVKGMFAGGDVDKTYVLLHGTTEVTDPSNRQVYTIDEVKSIEGIPSNFVGSI